jgi:hypothetical protein
MEHETRRRTGRPDEEVYGVLRSLVGSHIIWSYLVRKDRFQWVESACAEYSLQTSRVQNMEARRRRKTRITWIYFRGSLVMSVYVEVEVYVIWQIG